jgi:asparagine synthase (glutamine-hydrolysing)
VSGICGIVALDGSELAFAELEAIREALKRRGPDGAGTWIGKGAALGHTLLATTPESLVETMPLHHGDSGCTITADARLDNRDELFAKLGLDSGRRVVGDGELILRAHFKWGDDCVDQLLGDFAFAIWDQRAQRLFCARDQMGMRQLTYCHLEGRLFVFATEPTAVLRHAAVPQDLNLGRIADFLDDLEHSTLTETFYGAVSRLPPAHTLTLDQTGVKLRKYWELQRPPELLLSSDDEYAEAFLEVFTAAVRCRLSSPGPVGAMLSGGMDSGSVVAVASGILAADGAGPLQTFSVVGPDPDSCVETRTIHAAAQMAGIDPQLIPVGHSGEFSDELIQVIKAAPEPFEARMALIHAIYLAAHRNGLKVVLDGVAGDVSLGSSSCTALLLRRGRILQALREARGETRFWGPEWPLRSSFGAAAGRAWVPAFLRRARRSVRWSMMDRSVGRTGIISAQFAREAGLVQRRKQIRARDSMLDRIDADEGVRRIGNVGLYVGRERYDRAASSLAIEARDPFMDLRVLGLCLSLPWAQVQQNGWPKIVLRRALAGKLPERVRWRLGKEHLGSAFTMTLLRRLAPRTGAMVETLRPYVDLDRVTDPWAEGAEPTYCEDYMKAVELHNWLECDLARRVR